jgi:hypothetical protein
MADDFDARHVSFGDAYDRYAAEVPGFIPRLSRIFGQGSTSGYRHG